MFAVIISEKGGAERREVFDRTEINVGRVQGNDLMLPKGNVSKRHARLLYRDGRFIVTDLKSTNGTYVNGRKIAQATIVREGDKIYIGDFVLRIETTPGTPQASSSDDGIAVEHQSASDPGPVSSSAPGRISRGSGPRIEHRVSDGSKPQDIVSHFPLEQDPDDSVPYAVPGPPRVPGVPRGAGRSGPPPLNATLQSSVGRTTAPSLGVTGPPPMPSGIPGAPSAVPISPVPVARRALPASDRAPAPDPVHMAAHRGALSALVERVAEAVDIAALGSGAPPSEALAQSIERALTDRIAVLRADGHLPTDVDPEALVAEARRELLELGPIGPLLADEDVTEVQVVRHDFIVALQGRRQIHSEVAFTSEHALARCIRRLCVSSGSPLDASERYVDRRLPQGARMFAVIPPASERGHVLVLRKPHRADMTLEDLVRSGTISRAIAGLLTQCVAARANILVTGALGSGATSLVGALASAGSTDDRVIVLQEEDELIFNQPHTVSILLGGAPDEAARAIRAAAQVHPDRLVIGAFAGHVAAEVVQAIADGTDGVLAAARAPTLRQAVVRLAADLAATRPGLTADAARDWLASSFDLVLEIARLRDGRHRVLRLGELAIDPAGAIGVRDVFTFSVERTAAGGAVEGAFHPTGVVPAIVEDLAARGTTLDSSIFRRQR